MDDKVIAALAHRGKPKRTIERLTDEEKAAIATVWENHGATLGPEFESAFGEIWDAHQKRWAQVLDDNKATASEDADVIVEETEIVDE